MKACTVPCLLDGSNAQGRGASMRKTTTMFAPEVRDRAMWMSLDHERDIPPPGQQGIYCEEGQLHSADAARTGREVRRRLRQARSHS